MEEIIFSDSALQNISFLSNVNTCGEKNSLLFWFTWMIGATRSANQPVQTPLRSSPRWDGNSRILKMKCIFPGWNKVELQWNSQRKNQMFYWIIKYSVKGKGYSKQLRCCVLLPAPFYSQNDHKILLLSNTPDRNLRLKACGQLQKLI